MDEVSSELFPKIFKDFCPFVFFLQISPFSPGRSRETLCGFSDRMLESSSVRGSTHEVTIKVSTPPAAESLCSSSWNAFKGSVSGKTQNCPLPKQNTFCFEMNFLEEGAGIFLLAKIEGSRWSIIKSVFTSSVVPDESDFSLPSKIFGCRTSYYQLFCVLTGEDDSS